MYNTRYILRVTPLQQGEKSNFGGKFEERELDSCDLNSRNLHELTPPLPRVNNYSKVSDDPLMGRLVIAFRPT